MYKYIKVYKKGILRLDKYLLTHYPRQLDEQDTFNYYGHIHNQPEEEIYKDGKHKCISLERTSYKPIILGK